MRTVYFFTSPTCGACDEWKPTIEEFVQRNFVEKQRALVLRLNPSLREYSFPVGRKTWAVRYTPSAAVMERGQILRYVEGRLLTIDELEDFVFNDREPEQDEDEEENNDD